MLLCREMPNAFPMKSPSTCSTTASNTTGQWLQRSTLPATASLPMCRPQSAPPRHFNPQSLRRSGRTRRARARQVRVSGFGVGCFLERQRFRTQVRAHVHTGQVPMCMCRSSLSGASRPTQESTLQDLARIETSLRSLRVPAADKTQCTPDATQ